MDQKVPKDSQNLAGRVYEPSDYQKKDELSSGLAKTHEQFSDTYMEGEIGAVIDNENGKDIPIGKKGDTQK
ncbi:YozQ family protein [Bacillus sp. EB600]|uniref:YozQ family protein n=1 Tax=Bacillus sp. EB600 TaxID=2806345 RepID=UPI00210EDB05|nr:YozQ family protein [Bacillus sp. EB600]MCQ6278928.1 YozQ family protein [Bacillus sp. EB600]